jgi:hypothetical protein
MVVYVEMVANQVRIGFESARLWLAALPATFCCDLFACWRGGGARLLAVVRFAGWRVLFSWSRAKIWSGRHSTLLANK